MTTRATELAELEDAEPPALSIASADRCPSCGADMTPDQRYCVECGTRRGQARFAVNPTASAVPAPTAEPPVRRISSSVTLLTGLAVLLLALGVGVLIGQNGSSSASGKPSYNITVAGGGTGAGASATGSSAGAAAGSSGASSAGTSKSSSSKGSGGTKSSGVTASVSGKSGPTVNASELKTKAGQQAAVKQLSTTKVQLKNGKTLAPATQKMGGSCTAGTVGCNANGKFDGSYFGGG